MSPKLARLAIKNEQTPSLANVWQKNGVYLLLVGEINLPYATTQAASLTIISKLDELWQNQATTVDTTEEILETVLLELNKTLWQIFSPYPYNPAAPRYHLSLAVARDSEISVSILGNASAFVVSMEKFTNIIKVALSTDKETVLNRKPIFQQLVSGSLKNQEALILINPSVLDYFSVAQLRNMIGQYSPGQCVNELKKALADLDNQPPVSLIIYKMEPVLTPAKTKVSLTHKISASSDLDLGWVAKLCQMIFKRKEPELARLSNTTSKISRGAKVRKNYLIRVFKWLVNFIKNFPWRRNDIKDRLISFLGKTSVKYNRLPVSQKTMALIAILLIFILSFSILSSGKQSFTDSQQKKYQTKITDIRELLSQTEAAFIYHDDNKANYLLRAIYTELEQLPKRTIQEKESYTKLLTSYHQLEQKITRQITITELTLTADLTKISNQSWRGILIGKNILAYNQEGILAEIKNNQTNKLLTIPGSAGAPKLILPLANNRLFVNTDTNNAWLVNLNNKSTLQLTKQLPAALDMASYTESRVYLLTKTSPTIQRLTVSDKDLTSPANWLASGQSLANNTISLAIDGSIYTLSSSGEIVKYIKGRQQNWVLNNVPNLAGGTKIRTFSETDYLYILNPKDKQIILITKDGKLGGKFILPTLNEINDLMSNEKDKLLYILGDNKIWQIDLASYLNG